MNLRKKHLLLFTFFVSTIKRQFLYNATIQEKYYNTINKSLLFRLKHFRQIILLRTQDKM